MVELLKPAGPELARRWVAALMRVPEDEREAVVESVEVEIRNTYEQDGAPEGGDA